jgi:hypothetical protein
MLEWVNWFNNWRLLEPIGNIPPVEVEQRYYAMLEQPAMAASLKPNGRRRHSPCSPKRIGDVTAFRSSGQKQPLMRASADGHSGL